MSVLEVESGRESRREPGESSVARSGMILLESDKNIECLFEERLLFGLWLFSTLATEEAEGKPPDPTQSDGHPNLPQPHKPLAALSGC